MCNKVAVLLAGGKGTRLRPYTLSIPKPLVVVGEYPILEIIVRQLKMNGFTDIYIAVNHQAEMIREYFGSGDRFNIRIKYFMETKPLGTIGPLYGMQPFLPEHFIVMNGDVLTDLPYADFLKDHITNKSIFTISGKVREEIIDYGVLHVDDESQLIGFQEKPISRHIVSMGVYAMSKDVLKIVPKDTHFGFDDLMLTLLKRKMAVNVRKYNGYWNDIGRPSDYEQAIKDVDSLKDTF